MDRWKWFAVGQGLVLVSLLTFIEAQPQKYRFTPLGNHEGDGWYFMTDQKTGQVCYGGPARPYQGSGDELDRTAWEQSYKGTGMPYCKDLR
jgi:hypothetical protein